MPIPTHPPRPLADLLTELEAAVRAGDRARATQLEQTILQRLTSETADRAAPDVDRDLFLDLARLYPEHAECTTLYATNGDLPVRLAAQLPDDGWVRTTDLARIDAEGFVWIVGRADQTILRGGFKVQPDVVTSALERHPDVRGAAVFGIDDERLGQVPVAAVELHAGSRVGPDDLVAHLRPLLAPYEVPARIVVVEELPRTPSGKADLAAARSLVRHGAIA